MRVTSTHAHLNPDTSPSRLINLATGVLLNLPIKQAPPPTQHQFGLLIEMDVLCALSCPYNVQSSQFITEVRYDWQIPGLYVRKCTCDTTKSGP